jgi:hypothetical protein
MIDFNTGKPSEEVVALVREKVGGETAAPERMAA